MELVPSTLIALAALAAMLLRGPGRSVGIFLLTLPFGAAAAFNLPALGGATIGVADLAALGLFGLVLLTPAGLAGALGAARPFGPGFWLLLLAAYATVSALFFPRIFAGETEVFAISRAANSDGIAVHPLMPGTGNLTQLFRILLGVCAFAALATLARRRPDPARIVGAMLAVTAVHAALGLLDLVSAAAGAAALLEPIRTANYAILDDHYMIGLKRMIGGFPEASAFGVFSVGLFGFWLAYWVRATKQGALPYGRLAPWMLALSAFLVLRSTSSAAYVSVTAFTVTWALWSVLTRAEAVPGKRSISLLAAGAVALWCVGLALFAAYQTVAPVTAYLDQILFSKLDTASGVERMSWNAQAWQNFRDTAGFGAGLGSVRASTWALATLGSLGAVGTGLYLVFLLSLTRTRLPEDDAQPGSHATLAGLKAGCLALFMAAMMVQATPDLGLFFFALAGLATGLARGAALESWRRAATPAGDALPVRGQSTAMGGIGPAIGAERRRRGGVF